MSVELTHNYEYIAAHIKDYIEDNKFFDTFAKEDICRIMKNANLTPKDFTLLNQSTSAIKPYELYVCIRNAKVSIKNSKEAILFLKSMQKFLNLQVLDGVIDFL
ncbi:hypothetical protein TVAG_080880 [Trichomonas vaginalis G3]|uniref:Uncharacterized protein n=1 Tax=Trichomonas vaginalis (strain ATCC PRA-98 / G3) TaxID=412133 RepID=A2EPB1_TRIV3|nr:proteasome regulatory particle assembly [Trichomonas vaginalis G3]EAY05496.1 hypothetical protein TVAG_080880 [Trichomonas vaginalis G3]KAI5507799.1 proteasome regulatory particle assembly [Trichomonas vaginalis G3]|eukprot:XP_001317719.1 hypothetical protein [Trichomonas vaginalis G3]